jgi:hypothetical protein
MTPTNEILAVRCPNRVVGMTHQLACCVLGMSAFLARALTVQVEQVLLQDTLSYSTGTWAGYILLPPANNHIW